MSRRWGWALVALVLTGGPLSAQVRQTQLPVGGYFMYVDNTRSSCTIGIDGSSGDVLAGYVSTRGLYPWRADVRRIRADGRVIAEFPSTQHTSLVVSEGCGVTLLQMEDPRQLYAESQRRIANIEARLAGERHKRTLLGLGGLVFTGVGAALLSEAEDGNSPAGGIALTVGLYGLISWFTHDTEPTAYEEQLLMRANSVIRFLDSTGLPR